MGQNDDKSVHIEEENKQNNNEEMKFESNTSPLIEEEKISVPT